MRTMGRDERQLRRPAHRIPWATVAVAMLAAVAPISLGGCDDDDDGFEDLVAPAIPNGVYTITADRAVFVRWNPNREGDLAGYHVLSNTDGGSEYFIIATIDARDPDFYFEGSDPADPADDFLEFPDFDVENGTYYWYAIAAFDKNGNESALSLETVVDVPRPEGTELFLSDRNTDAATAGVDFSDLRPGIDEDPQAWNDPSTDVYFEIDANGDRWLVAAPQGVDIQDYGYVGFDVATYAPTMGWSQAGRAEAIHGHTYVFRINEPSAPAGRFNYAKAEILDLPQQGVQLFWGYQAVANERELKAASRDSGPSRSR